MTAAPGLIRDSIIDYLAAVPGDASTQEITLAVKGRLGDVAPSSVRSYLNLNTPTTFERTSRGRYRLGIAECKVRAAHVQFLIRQIGKASLVNADCFDWLAAQPTVTPYGD